MHNSSIKLESSESFLIGAIYGSPSCMEATSKQLINLMNKAMNCGKNYTIIIGDLNIPIGMTGIPYTI